MDALGMLMAMSNFAETQQSPSSATKPIKLATVDPAYVGPPSATLPKVTFDGESTMSGKTYPVLGGFTPLAGERVVLIPVGTTYLVIGSTAHTGAVTVDNFVSGNMSAIASGSTYQSGTVPCGVAFKAGRSGKVLVHWSGRATASNTFSVYMSVTVREGSTVNSGTVIYGAADTHAIQEGGDNFTHGDGMSTLVSGLTPGADYNATFMARTSNVTSVTAVADRKVIVQPA